MIIVTSSIRHDDRVQTMLKSKEYTRCAAKLNLLVSKPRSGRYTDAHVYEHIDLM